MTHFHSEKWTLGDLLTEYFHDPEDWSATFDDFLEDKLSEGHEFIGCTGFYGGTGAAVFMFKVVAK